MNATDLFCLNAILPSSRKGTDGSGPFDSTWCASLSLEFDCPVSASRIGITPIVIGSIKFGLQWFNDVTPVTCNGNKMDCIGVRKSDEWMSQAIYLFANAYIFASKNTILAVEVRYLRIFHKKTMLASARFTNAFANANIPLCHLHSLHSWEINVPSEQLKREENNSYLNEVLDFEKVTAWNISWRNCWHNEVYTINFSPQWIAAIIFYLHDGDVINSTWICTFV